MTLSIPLSGESKPKVKSTRLPATPRRSLLCRVWGAMRIPWGMWIDLRRRDLVPDLTEERRAVLAHHDQALRERAELVHHATLRRVGFAQDRVEGRHDRHPQLAEQRQDVGAGLAAEDPVFVLHGHDVEVVDVE